MKDLGYKGGFTVCRGLKLLIYGVEGGRGYFIPLGFRILSIIDFKKEKCNFFSFKELKLR